MIYGLRVIALGGGTGLGALLAGLKHFTRPPSHAESDAVYFADLAAVVTVTDDGGSSGRLRNEFDMLPPGDIRNCLVSLSTDESLLSSLFQHRFAGNGELGGHNFGNLFLTALTSVTGDFHEAVRAASQVLSIQGRIFPSTNERVSLVAELDNGDRIEGETSISNSNTSIRRVSLDPPFCTPPRDALDALERADLIILGPGSLYTSLIPNLLVPGVADAIGRSAALKVFLSNIMTQPGETTGYTLADHVRALSEHCPDLELSYVLANGAPIPQSILGRYREEGAEPVFAVQDGVPCPVVVEDLLQAGPVVRHDGDRTAETLQTLFRRARVSPLAR